jgi:RNA polymerase sigma-70 factor (ECF subfamily)
MTVAEREPAAEAAFLERCRRGEAAAWAELYARFAAPMARFLRRSAGRDADVEDLVQQVFVECFAGIGGYRGDAPLRAWLYGIAARVAARARRTAFRWWRRAAAVAAETAWDGETPRDDAFERLVARDAIAALEDVIAGLPARIRVVWVMVELEGLTSAEVARALRLPAGTVRARLCRGRKTVHEGLRARGCVPEGEALPRGPRLAAAAGQEVTIP